MELSMDKTTQLPQGASSTSTPAQVTTAVQSALSHSHHHRHSHANSGNGVPGGGIGETDDEGDNLKLNRSSNMQAKDDLLGQQQQQQPPQQPQHHHLQTEQRRIAANGSIDGRYKLMDEMIVLECVDWYRLEFCLNGGRCFLYPIMNHTLFSCECAGDYVGERCEAKTPEKIPPTIRPRFVLAKTIGGPLVFGLAFMDILLLLFLFCKNSNRN